MGYDQKLLADAIIKMCEENGIKYEIVHIPINKKVRDAVNKYIQRIERAYREAPNSKLIFKYSFA
jgi:diketogulonate reductase-like aldo/keto reductase